MNIDLQHTTLINHETPCTKKSACGERKINYYREK